MKIFNLKQQLSIDYQAGRQDERIAVVRYLRKMFEEANYSGNKYDYVYDVLASEIETGNYMSMFTTENDFQQILLKSINDKNITDEMIARRFGVSKPTIKRWKDGHTTPHEALQRKIYEWLERM